MPSNKPAKSSARVLVAAPPPIWTEPQMASTMQTQVKSFTYPMIMTGERWIGTSSIRVSIHRTIEFPYCFPHRNRGYISSSVSSNIPNKVYELYRVLCTRANKTAPILGNEVYHPYTRTYARPYPLEGRHHASRSLGRSFSHSLAEPVFFVPVLHPVRRQVSLHVSL